jgi:multidrug efflux pump subunit AcrA (membrane-fusion protein)
MPPRLETVVMSPFQEDEARPQPTEPGIRRMVSSVLDRSTIAVVVVVALTVIAAVIGYYFWAQHEATLEARRVHVITPRPAAVYRWFDAPGSAVVAGTATLAFAAGGSVADVLPPGSHYATGEVIAKLQGAAAHEAEVNHARSRVAYNQQVRDSMKAAGNLPEMRRAEIKIVEKQAQLDEAEAALDRLVIRATEPGEISEVIAKRGMLVEANAPAVRVGTGQIRGEFILAAKDAEAAARLGFCRVEIIPVSPSAAEPGGAAGSTAADGGGAAANDGSPRFADCRITPSPQPAAPTGQRLEVELPANAGILLGQTLRLARVRYDGVFPVPRSGVVRVGDTDRVFVVGPGNVAQARAITIADSDAEEVVISQGIDVGDRVIIDPPSDLRDGKLLSIQ